MMTQGSLLALAKAKLLTAVNTKQNWGYKELETVIKDVLFDVAVEGMQALEEDQLNQESIK